jgi:hypothetical protein
MPILMVVEYSGNWEGVVVRYGVESELKERRNVNLPETESHSALVQIWIGGEYHIPFIFHDPFRLTQHHNSFTKSFHSRNEKPVYRSYFFVYLIFGGLTSSIMKRRRLRAMYHFYN